MCRVKCRMKEILLILMTSLLQLYNNTGCLLNNFANVNFYVNNWNVCIAVAIKNITTVCIFDECNYLCLYVGGRLSV